MLLMMRMMRIIIGNGDDGEGDDDEAEIDARG